jgi:hypothetical protein
VPNGEAIVQIDFIPGTPNAQGWIDWFEFSCRRDLSSSGVRQLLFRDWNSVAPGMNGQFHIKNANGSQVWEVTNPLVPVRMETSVAGTDAVFSNDCSRLREYVCFNPDSAYTPIAMGRINNQNLHQLQPADFVIVTDTRFEGEANRLAAYHLQRENIRSIVVTTDEVFNEFSSGTPDPTAIRDFVKMLYDRAGTDTTRRPKYLLLFGDASFDYKDRIAGNTNLVPAYESVNSLDPLNTYTSDDFFGFLSDSSDINNNSTINLLPIGIGRVPANTVAEAKSYVDKVISYNATSSMGSWRNQMTFVADDEDFNLHLHDAETITTAAKSTNALFNQDKIYLDAFQQESSSAGARYPAATQAVEDDIYNGTLLFNYTGHGGSRRLAEEIILDQDIINR